MEHLENDMDDLFQKAGELYPLKTTGSDWDAVAGKLQNEAPGEAHDLTGPTSMTTRRRRWLLLLLLIPLGLGVFYFTGNHNQRQQNAVSAKSSGGSADQNKTERVIPDNQTVPAGSVDNSKADNNKTASGKKNNSANGSQNGTPLTKSSKLTYAAVGRKQLTGNNRVNSKNQISSAHDKTKSDLNSANSNQGSKETTTVAANNSTDNPSSTAESVPKAAVAVVPPAVSTQKETATAKNNTDKTESAKKTSADSSQANKKTHTASKQSKGFYVGLFAGPDLSAVKFQGVHQIGSSIGLSVGYRFNRLAVETGLTWDQKYYYSSAEYFKTSPSYPYPPNTTVSGHCDMFEIPLLIQYDFSSEKNHGFFAKAGFSSYLMTHQYYSKKVNGVDYGSWPWDEHANYIFSIVQLSGGYEFSLNAKTKIHIEPYIKIPLTGLGEGNMPISSAGIYFGFTHSFR